MVGLERPCRVSSATTTAAGGGSSPSSSYNNHYHNVYDKNKNNNNIEKQRTVIDEVEEIIVLPERDEEGAKRELQSDPNEIVLSANVFDELREYSTDHRLAVRR